MKFKVNKCGHVQWHTVNAMSHQDAVEKYFGVATYWYEDKDHIEIYSDNENKCLYAVYEVK